MQAGDKVKYEETVRAKREVACQIIVTQSRHQEDPEQVAWKLIYC